MASPQMYAPAAYAYAEAQEAPYYVYEQETPANNEWSDVAMLAVAGAMVGAAIGYKTKGKKASGCGNAYCTCGAACGCGPGCQCGVPVSMLGVAGRGATLVDKIRNAAL